MAKIPQSEQMTTITYSRVDSKATVVTSDTYVIRQLAKMANQYPAEYVIVEADEHGIVVQMPKERIRFAHAQSRSQYAGNK